MEVIQGKPRDKKIVFAQEIAFAKALAGNNKTLRDRALKKLKKWLTIRGNGKWEFTEEEFLRIWTGLFYCMWMSDKFLIQEELAESISSLIHCFKKQESALLFIKCFNKRILMDWEGLDQYRIDKFNMLVRRFLRQTFLYVKEHDWDDSLLHKLMGILFNVVLHRDNSLGFVLHFISIYNEELAKVSKGKISTLKVLILIEPFVKLLARSKDQRILKETEDFFIYLMRQTDTGIEYEEKFQAWREQGFPGEGPHCMGATDITNNMSEDEEEIKENDDGDDDDLENQDEPLDPRAGSVHVFLPQIPIDIEGFLNLFKKHQNSKFSTKKGRKTLKNLTQKYTALKKGKFPEKIKKDTVLDEKLRKKKLPLKNARKLLEFTEKLKEDSIQSKEFKKLNKQLEEQEDSDLEDNEEEELRESENENEESKEVVKKTKKRKKKPKKINDNVKDKTEMTKKVKITNESSQEVKENHKENGEVQKKKRKKKKNKKLIEEEKQKSEENTDEEIVKTKKPLKINGITNGLQTVKKTERKRKILSNWQVQELDKNSPEYYKIKTPKIIRLEKKIDVDSDCCCEENNTEQVEDEPLKEKKPENEVIIPQFWQKAKQKVDKKNKNKLFLNPFAKVQNESKSPGRRISFALDKNMAQENDQYLEEVKNSPKVPFDGSKKPVQSALKSGLAPSPVNPFYNFKKIKF